MINIRSMPLAASQRARPRDSVPATLLSALFLSTLPACSTIEVAEPLTQELAANDPDTQMEFWHTLYERKRTSNDEAFHAVLLFLDGQDPAADYAGRVNALKERGLLRQGFDRPAAEAVKRGELAVVIYNALEVRGGVIASLCPHSPRYTMRELQYHNIYPVGSPHQTFSGGEFVSIIGRMEDYQRVFDPTRTRAKELPGGADEAQPAPDQPPGPEDASGEAQPG